MIIVTTNHNARNIFEKYDTNIAAFTTGKSKGINDADIQIDFAKLHILPDEDVVNAVLNGDMKAKKVIKKAKKALTNPTMDQKDLCIEMAQIVNIVSSDRKMSKKEIKNIRKHGPNVIVIVLDDPGDDPIAKKRNKFYTEYLVELFSCFGISVITQNKILKKLFNKGGRKKVVRRVAEFIRENDAVRVNAKGMRLKKLLMGFFAVELRQAAIFNMGSMTNGIDISKHDRDVLLKTLLDVYTNNNFKVAADLKKKKMKKILKALKEKNKVACKAYNTFSELLNTAMGVDMDMPEVKNGYKEKKGESVPKMKVEKFIKYFTKKKYTNFDIMMLLYAHTSLALCDVVIGSKEYNKVMSTAIGYVGFEESFSKAFIAAAKKMAAPVETK